MTAEHIPSNDPANLVEHDFAAEITQMYDDYAISDGYNRIFDWAKDINRILAKTEPWKMDNPEKSQILDGLYLELLKLSDFLAPVTPTIA